MIELLISSFVAGVLTVLAPCILPLLPVIIGGTIIDGKQARPPLNRALVIIGSLAISIVVFTLLLKATTALLGVPQVVWSVIAGGIVLLFGVSLLLPSLWDHFLAKTGLQAKMAGMLPAPNGDNNTRRDVLLGAALGPIFNSCSPTYAVIVAVILPATFIAGLFYLFAYVLGMCTVLLIIALFGQAAIARLRWASNPNGWFKKTIGAIFIAVGLIVLFGIDKQIQTFVLDKGWYDPIMRIEQSFESY